MRTRGKRRQLKSPSLQTSFFRGTHSILTFLSPASSPGEPGMVAVVRPSWTHLTWTFYRLQLFELQHGYIPQGPSFRSALLQHGSPQAASPSPPASPWAPLHGLQLQSGVCSCRGSMGCTSFRPHPLLHRGLFWTDLDGCRVFLSHFLIPLSQLLLHSGFALS